LLRVNSEVNFKISITDDLVCLIPLPENLFRTTGYHSNSVQEQNKPASRHTASIPHFR